MLVGYNDLSIYNNNLYTFSDELYKKIQKYFKSFSLLEHFDYKYFFVIEKDEEGEWYIKGGCIVFYDNDFGKINIDFRFYNYEWFIEYNERLIKFNEKYFEWWSQLLLNPDILNPELNKVNK